jgi:hypothetical protein
MISYLINTTAIWLLSLLCFDVFLRRETYHAYNRAFLLLTMIAGVFIPLYSRPSFTATPVTAQPLLRIDGVRTTIIQTFTPASAPAVKLSGMSWLQIAGWLYVAGAAVSLFFLLRETAVLIRYYRTGKKTKDGRYTIVETYRDHGPFSVGRILFASSIKNYEKDQWQIVLQHEKRHSILLHIADTVVLQALQIVFWFHPLVYLYRRRLLLVHEYQADATAAEQPLQYGHFLLEQALLQTGPLPAHSFNRSPIKNRLSMLTKNASSKMARAKYWLVAPVLVIGLICCTKENQDYAKKRVGNTIIYKGNTFGLNKEVSEKIMTTNPETGKTEETAISIPQYPVKMNGKEIYDDRTVKELPVYAEGSLEEKILDVVKDDLAKLPDAENYTISIFNTIVDEKGTLVYFDVRGLEQYFDFSAPDKGRITIDPQLKATVEAKVNNYLGGTHQFKPARLDGSNVICNANLRSLNFAVKNHQVTYHIPA